MTPEFWRRVVDVVTEFKETPHGDHGQRLAVLCRGDAELLEAVRQQIDLEVACPPDFFPTDEPDPALAPAAVSGFQWIRKLGHGGFGTVYEALDVKLGRRVAVKLVDASARSDDVIKRFHREAEAAAKLSHPGIVTVFSSGNDGALHWIAMELVVGRSLAEELKAPQSQAFLPTPGHPDRLPAALRLIANVADALHHAHEHGVVHRDVKPGNILLQSDRSTKVADFGLALARQADGSLITDSTHVLGTPSYMSPEQAGAGGGVDRRTDVYSIGAVLFELLCGQPPFGVGSASEVLERVKHWPTPRLRTLQPTLPSDLDAVCAKAMAHDQQDRYATAAELAADLRCVLEYKAVRATQGTWWQSARRWWRRHGRRTVAGIAAVTMLSLTGHYLWREARASAIESQRAQIEPKVAAALANGDDDRLVELRAQVVTLDDQSKGHIRRAIDALLDRIHARGAQLETEAEQLLLRACGDAETTRPFDQAAFFNAWHKRSQAAKLLRAPSTVPTDLATYYPRLSLRTEHANAMVMLRPMLLPSGEYDRPIVTLPAPLDRVPVPPGQYRVVGSRS